MKTNEPSATQDSKPMDPDEKLIRLMLATIQKDPDTAEPRILARGGESAVMRSRELSVVARSGTEREHLIAAAQYASLAGWHNLFVTMQIAAGPCEGLS